MPAAFLRVETTTAVILRCERSEPRRMIVRRVLPSFEARKSAHLRMTAEPSRRDDTASVSFPGCDATRSGALLIRVHTLRIGPGSAEQRKSAAPRPGHD